MNVEDFINVICDRPLMYVEKKRIDYIYYLIIGYLGGKDNKKELVDIVFKSDFRSWTLNWVKNNLDNNYENKTFFWYNIYQDITDNDTEAVNLFFKLSREFFLDYHADNDNKKA